MLLKLGKMTSREVAEWMGISYKHYANHRKEKLEILKIFCDFSECYGGVIVDKIYVSEYIKDINDDVFIYLDYVLRSKNKICSINGIVRAIIADSNNNYTEKDFNTLRYRLRKAGEKGFGITKLTNSKGAYGSRNYIWAIKIDDYNTYRFMSEIEENLFNQLRAKYENSEIGRDFSDEVLLNADAYEAGEISAIEVAERTVMAKNAFRDQVLFPFREVTGYQIVRATAHEVFMDEVERVYKEIGRQLP